MRCVVCTNDCTWSFFSMSHLATVVEDGNNGRANEYSCFAAHRGHVTCVMN